MVVSRILSAAWHTLKADWKALKVELTEDFQGLRTGVADTQASPVRTAAGPDSLPLPDLLTSTTTVSHALGGLATQRHELHKHVASLAQGLELTPHQQSLDQVVKILHEMDTALATAQETHTRLARSLHDKRLLLGTRDQALVQAMEEKELLQRTIDTITQAKAQETHTRQRLQERLTQLEADLTQAQARYDLLTKQYDTLVGEHHQLFLSYQKIANAPPQKP